jgi:DUF2958 family protein
MDVCVQAAMLAWVLQRFHQAYADGKRAKEPIMRRPYAVEGTTGHEQQPIARPDLAHDDAHDLMPDWLAETVPALGTTEHARDPLLHVKLFTPDAGWRWYIAEYDAVQRLALAFVPSTGTANEWDEISLDMLATRRGPMGLAVERDLFWRPAPLSRVRRGEVW